MQEIRDKDALRPNNLMRDEEPEVVSSTRSSSSPAPSYVSLINMSTLTVLEPIYSAYLLELVYSGSRFQAQLPIQINVSNTAIPMNSGVESTNEEFEILSSLLMQQTEQTNQDDQTICSGNMKDNENDIKSRLIPIDKTTKEHTKSAQVNNSNNRRIKDQHNRQSQDRQYTCQVCTRCFRYKHVLLNHERTHTGERPYLCTICEARFTRDHHLKMHMRIHTGEKPYNCNHCGSQFVQVANLQRHLRVHTEQRPYSCEFCDFRFSDSTHLKVHMENHNKVQVTDKRITGLPVLATVTSDDTFITDVVPEQTDPVDLSCDTEERIGINNEVSLLQPSAIAMSNSCGSNKEESIGPYHSEPSQFYRDDERRGIEAEIRNVAQEQRKERKVRRQRTSFSDEQIIALEKEYQSAEFIQNFRRYELAQELYLTETQIKIWFQNRRARNRRTDDQQQVKSFGLENPSLTPSMIPTIFSEGMIQNDNDLISTNDFGAVDC